LTRFISTVAAALVVTAAPVSAQTAPETMAPERVELRPLLEARSRYENVDQGEIDAQALTLRLRAGVEALHGPWSLLAEGEGTIDLVDTYHPYPFPNPGTGQSGPVRAVIPDPPNIEVNRLQLQYRFTGGAITAGRQRINLDDQRWVGSVSWRQNEQTFDALRGEAQHGPVGIDLTYAISQRTIFGRDAGPRTAFDGEFIFAGLYAQRGPVRAKLFAYLLDHEEDLALANSSQTYGGLLTSTIPIAAGTSVNLRASYANQSDYSGNPFDFSADYWAIEAGTNLRGFNVAGGWERLGSDGGRAVQTPMATLHKFNGWADIFLTTPANGLEDLYLSIGRSFDIAQLPGLNANLTYHRFESAVGDIPYGDEWDASVGLRIAIFGVQLKFARYRANDFGRDTTKIWLQVEWNH
jgi:hypothetical protein